MEAKHFLNEKPVWLFCFFFIRLKNKWKPSDCEAPIFSIREYEYLFNSITAMYTNTQSVSTCQSPINRPKKLFDYLLHLKPFKWMQANY